MRKSDAVEYFGSPTKLAKAAGVSLPAVSRWGEVIPERRAARLARLTGDELKYDPAMYQDQQPTDAA
ncbi:TPA: Cro/CI family transcriptional regulator [Serratia marcescens]|uniref:Cro/CI family transcriptional regulator n=1 Tax=Serratia TaxID=613 RepID=UPI0011B9C264|nr:MULTISPECIES: Cro/CI family transcriptional regulator [Serratia]MDE1508149.1 Cro/CI family transcriptional regulator [Serratia nevei]MDK5933450.1 Cro/CI family transcriptional regulator [Serratia nevei]MEC5547251.1 Cro/CI family transcriptional regulator [Serratia nevei]MEC5626675.1 Cro/CI family transcriptional regulator [Serratia nevei]MEC5685077.1 Cro/CI family transcriptional regulator [Serratia nevei]